MMCHTHAPPSGQVSIYSSHHSCKFAEDNGRPLGEGGEFFSCKMKQIICYKDLCISKIVLQLLCNMPRPVQQTKKKQVLSLLFLFHFVFSINTYIFKIPSDFVNICFTGRSNYIFSKLVTICFVICIINMYKTVNMIFLTGFQYNFLYTCPYSVIVAWESSSVAGLSTSPSI